MSLLLEMNLFTIDGSKKHGLCTIKLETPRQLDGDFTALVEISGGGLDLRTPCFGVDPIQTILAMIHFVWFAVHNFEASGGQVFLHEARTENSEYSSEVWLKTVADLFCCHVPPSGGMDEMKEVKPDQGHHR